MMADAKFVTWCVDWGLFILDIASLSTFDTCVVLKLPSGTSAGSNVVGLTGSGLLSSGLSGLI